MSQNELTSKIRTLKELETLIAQATEEIETIKDTLKAEMTELNADTLTIDVYKVRYTEVKSRRFDSTAFKKDVPALYEQYSKLTTTRRFTIA